MNRSMRLLAASGAGLALTFTASPAMADHGDDDSNGAHVEHRELAYPNETYEYRLVVKHHGDDYYNTTNARDQWSYDDGVVQSSYDWKTHYVELENVTVLGSQNTITDNGETCRVSTLYVIAGGETRRVKEDFC